MLGNLEIVIDGHVLALGGRKERIAMALLVANPGRVVPATRHYDALWGEEVPRTAAKSLQAHISRLRKALQAADGLLSIATVESGYVLTVAAGVLDVEIVRDLAAAARDAVRAGDHDAAVAAYDSALAIWRGPSFGDLSTRPFAVAEASRLEELRVVVVEERADAMLALGRHGILVGELEPMCEAYPFQERLWYLRMLALYRAGRQAEALRVFQELRRRLAEGLGIEPSREVAVLEREILNQAPSLGWKDPGPTADDGASTPRVRIMLVDDHPVWRDAVRRFLEVANAGIVVGEFADGAAAVDAAERLLPEVILMDLHLPGAGGIDAIGKIAERLPDVRILVVSASDNPTDVLDALQAGAHGYLLKTSVAQEFADAVQRVRAGEPVFSAAIAPTVLADLRRARQTTPRATLGPLEHQIVRLVGAGWPAEDVADKLNITESAVQAGLARAIDALRRVADKDEAPAGP